jgi:peptide/nickel transport system permease protein
MKTQRQLAIVKKKYGFDQALSTQYLYYLNDLAPISVHSNTKSDYTYLAEELNAIQLFTIGDFHVVLKHHI